MKEYSVSGYILPENILRKVIIDGNEATVTYEYVLDDDHPENGSEMRTRTTRDPFDLQDLREWMEAHCIEGSVEESVVTDPAQQTVAVNVQRTVTATYLCGHTHKISGPMAQEATEQAKGQYCVGCTEFHSSKGFYPIVENELVTLEGSEKQVSWAMRLRNERIDLIHNYMARSIHQSANTHEEIARGRAAFLQVINEQTQAKWWIDSRDRAGLKPFAAAYEKAYAEHV